VNDSIASAAAAAAREENEGHEEKETVEPYQSLHHDVIH